MIIQVLTNLGWIEVSLDQVQEGDTFRFVSADRTSGNLPENNSGSDTFKAVKDAAMDESGVVVVTIEKPTQPKFSADYLARLRDFGASIEVRGSAGATGATGQFIRLG